MVANYQLHSPNANEAKFPYRQIHDESSVNLQRVLLMSRLNSIPSRETLNYIRILYLYGQVSVYPRVLYGFSGKRISSHNENIKNMDKHVNYTVKINEKQMMLPNRY
jgi:hypothetical protein